jgi:hypothetical protein
MKARSVSVSLLLLSSFLLAAPRPALGIVNQSDGTIIPRNGSLQTCLDKSPVYNAATNPAPGEGTMPFRIRDVQDARTQPQTFAIPAPTGGRQVSTFTNLGQHSGFSQAFGWYHVGDNPRLPSSQHEIFPITGSTRCDCPCTGGPRSSAGPRGPGNCLTWTPQSRGRRERHRAGLAKHRAGRLGLPPRQRAVPR